MPKVDVDALPWREGSSYPAPFDVPCAERRSKRLGVDLSQFGVNLCVLRPGAWSSQRHWHAREDELVYVLEGELVLVEDGGETVLRPGDVASFPAGTRDGHHLQNRSASEARFLAVGSRDPEDFGEYSDLDLTFGPQRYGGSGVYRRKDGTPY